MASQPLTEHNPRMNIEEHGKTASLRAPPTRRLADGCSERSPNIRGIQEMGIQDKGGEASPENERGFIDHYRLDLQTQIACLQSRLIKADLELLLAVAKERELVLNWSKLVPRVAAAKPRSKRASRSRSPVRLLQRSESVRTKAARAWMAFPPSRSGASAALQATGPEAAQRPCGKVDLEVGFFTPLPWATHIL